MGSRTDQVSRRRKAQRRGHFSEYLAAAWLILKGYRVLAIRHRTPLGEIDVIARRGEVVAFVEVKARRDERTALDAVSRTAQSRIRNASDLWILRYPDAAFIVQRYDIVAVTPWRLPSHFPDAF